MGRNDPKMIHFRRCHICGAVSEQNARVERCEHCHRAIAPFFYFNDEEAPVLCEDDLRPPIAPGEIRPLVGLSVYWR